MSFLAKKAISAFFLPLPIGITLILIGLILLWCCQRKQWPSIFISSGLLVLLFFSYTPLPNLLVNNLESQYQPLIKLPDNISDIVVLGGGVRADTSTPPNTQLTSASLSRLIEAIRLYKLYSRKNTNIKLVLSGGKVFGLPEESGVLENTAVILGVNPNNIILERGSQNTRQEVIYLKPTLKQQPFILVTSAFHMPRAMYLFKQYGLNPVAAPTQYLSDQSAFNAGHYFPRSSNLVEADIALHEYLGRLWADLHS